jgi:hypothetical protein
MDDDSFLLSDFAEESAPQQGAPAQPEQAAANTNLHFWNLQYYSPLFNVDTKEVLVRVSRSLMPFKFSFIETVKNNPDLYVFFL